MKTYTSQRYILGARCERGHSGNRRYAMASRSLAECVGCGDFRGLAQLPQFASRAEALAADRSFRATWPEDSAARVLAGEPR